MWINYKIPDGKMLKINVELEDNVIRSIKLTGDFFIFPNEAVEDIENYLINMNINDISDKLSKFIENNTIEVIGFSPENLEEIIKENI